MSRHKKIVSMTIDPGTLAQLDELASRFCSNRSKLVSRIIDLVVAKFMERSANNVTVAVECLFGDTRKD